MLTSEPFHRRDAWLPDDGPDPWLCTDLIERARGGEGEPGPNVLSLASWLLAAAPLRTLTAAWEAFAKLGSEEWDVHRGLHDAGHALSGAGEHARAVLAVAQAVLSPFAAPGARTSFYFGCEPGFAPDEALDLKALVSRSRGVRFLLFEPRDDGSDALVARALKQVYLEAVLERGVGGGPSADLPLCGVITRDFQRHATAVDAAFLDRAQAAGGFAVLAARSVFAIEHALRDVPEGEGLAAHIWSSVGTKVLMRSTDPRTKDLARGLRPCRSDQPDLLDVRPLAGLGPHECYVSGVDGRFQRRRLVPWTEARSLHDGSGGASEVLPLGVPSSESPGGDAA